MTDKLIEAAKLVLHEFGTSSKGLRALDAALAAHHSQQGSPDEHKVIAAFLERTGQYVTNDASRQAAIAEGVESRIAALEARIEKLEIALKWQGIRSI